MRPPGDTPATLKRPLATSPASSPEHDQQLRARRDSLPPSPLPRTPKRRSTRSPTFDSSDVSTPNGQTSLEWTPRPDSSRAEQSLEASSQSPSLQAEQDTASPSRCDAHHDAIMASGGGKWREEQILIICPGSRTTMAQLGCNELTPPAHRIPTRMFRDGNEWRPYRTYKRTKIVGGEELVEWVEDVDDDTGALYPIEGQSSCFQVVATCGFDLVLTRRSP